MSNKIQGDLPPGYMICTILGHQKIDDPDGGVSLVREVMEDDPVQPYILFEGPAEIGVDIHSERVVIITTGESASLHRGQIKALYDMLGKILERDNFLNGKIIT